LEFEIGSGVDMQAQDIRLVLYNLFSQVVDQHHEKLQQFWVLQVANGDY